MKLNLKSFIGILLLVTCVCVFVACNGGGSDEPINKPKETASPTAAPTSSYQPEFTLPEDEFETPSAPVSSSTPSPDTTGTPVGASNSPVSTPSDGTVKPTTATPAFTQTPTTTPKQTVTPTKTPTPTVKPTGGVLLPPDYL